MNRAEMAVAFGRGCGFASGRLLGATGPRMESYNWKAKPISPCLGAHEAHPKTTLYGVVFQKLNGPLLTSIRGPDAPATEWNANPSACNRYTFRVDLPNKVTVNTVCV